MKTKLAIFFVICGFSALALAQDKQAEKPAEQITFAKNIKITGIVTFSKGYKVNIRSKIAKNSAIVNDRIMVEGTKYTLNEQTFKITTRTIHDQKDYAGGAFVGGAYIIAYKIANNVVYFKYSHSAFSGIIKFTKKLN